MKDGYRYKDGKVLVTDYSDGKEREILIRHYQDNIDEILITENVIEKLQSEYKKLIDMYNTEDDTLYAEKYEIPGAIFLVILLTLLIGWPLSLGLSMVGVKPLVTLICFFFATSGLFYKLGVKRSIEEIKRLKKVLKGYDFAIDSVEKEIEKQQEKLKNLNENITREKLDMETDDLNSIQRGEYIQIDYVEKLKELREYLGLCYAVGYLSDNLDSYSSDYVNEKVKELDAGVTSSQNVKVLRRKFMDKMDER